MFSESRIAQRCLVLLQVVSIVTAQICPPADVASRLLQAPWAAQLGWSTSNWTGVTCEYEGKISIDLSNQGLSGPLPDSWSALSQLRWLYMSNNSISGTLPASWANLPQLLTLRLSNNSLSGTLPAFWSNFPQLETCDLGNNKLNGSLPDAWSAMAQLSSLDISNNRISGTLPASWSNLPKSISWFNSLYFGPISWSDVAQLTLLLDHNRLTGSLPSTWGNLTQLTDLDIGSNMITGSLPESWSNIPFSHLSLVHNSLTGTLPSSWSSFPQFDSGPVLMVAGSTPACTPEQWSCVNLVVLDLSNNSLNGTLPEEWAGLIWVGSLSLNNNHLSGNLPGSWGNMAKLAYLNLAGNHFGGTLPSSWGNLTELLGLDLSGNELTGSIPSKWKMTQMQSVTFADNQLSGQLPYAPEVILFNMSSNRFTAANFTNLPACNFLYFANNSLAGTFPSLEALPANLSVLDLSDNRLSGSLPGALPSNMTVLNISRNDLSGTLPGAWSTLEKLVVLIMDDNLFTGNLPTGWSELGKHSQNSLQFSVVNTTLGGKVPRQWVKQFCLSVFKPTEVVSLSTGLTVAVQTKKNLVTLKIGPDIQLPAQHASINVSLRDHVYTFDYSSPGSLCGILYAARNLGLVWGAFAALLVIVFVCTTIWLRHKQGGSTSGVCSRLERAVAFLDHAKLHIPKQVAIKLQFFLLDVVYFLYSQISDIITIHQVFGSGQLQYAYLLLVILVIPFAFMLLPVAYITVRVCQDKMNAQSPLRTVLVCVVGVALSPVVFLILELELVLHGLGIPVPKRLQFAHVDMYSMHRLQTYAESFLNALPQAVLQSKLYLMGNNPSGVHVYIDTTLFLFSIVGSMASLLKTVVFINVEWHAYSCTPIRYFTKLLTFSSLEDYRLGGKTSSQACELISQS